MAKKPLKIKIKRLHSDAVIPKYATDGSAAFDFVAVDRVRLGNTSTYDTGVAVEVPVDHVMLVFSRSGHGFNHDLRLANCVGVIDSDYRGEVKVKLTHDDDRFTAQWPRVGDRVAQGIILPIPAVEFEEVEELSETKRGNGGFGSSGE